jgi:penicillin-binding protein 1A
LKLLAVAVLGLSFAGATALYFVVVHYARDLPSVEQLKRGYDPPQITRIYARDHTLLGSLFTERRTVVPFDQIPDAAKLAFLAAEDAHFYEHEGLNYWGILRALVANVRAGKMVQGGSTITQQVIKNVLLDQERSLRRKVREVLLVHRLEHSLSKDEIFWLYLNHIYLGHGRYGIEEASRFYFGKPCSALALDEAAILAGLVASPETYSPRRNPEKSLQRRSFVLRQMLAKGFVTKELYNATKDAPLRLAPPEETESRLAPEMMDHAKKLLERVVGKSAATGGFEVTTTVDPKLQSSARGALRHAIDDYLDRHDLRPPFTKQAQKQWAAPFAGTPKPFRVYTGVVESSDDQRGTLDVRVGDVVGRVSLPLESRYNPAHLPPSRFATKGAVLRVSFSEGMNDSDRPPLRLELGPEGALVAIDVRSREVVALVGSYEGVQGGLDRAVRTKRQPGSAFKPLLYSYALHTRRFTPATLLPVHHRGHGVSQDGPLAITLRDAVAHSNNEAATAVMRAVGAQGVVDWAHALGIQSKLEPDLSLALGSYEVSVLELANAYVTLANGGQAGEPHLVASITGPGETPIPLPAAAPERPVLGSDEAYLTTSLLQSVIESGTGRAARVLGRPAAGKTGTTNQAKDTWFVGYTPDLVAAVWIGYDDALPLGSGESGAKTALPAWIEFMKAAHEGRPKTGFARAAGVLSVEIDPSTGLLPPPGTRETRREEFLAGTEPTEMSPITGETDAGVPLASSGTPDFSGDGAPATTTPPAPSVELPPF